MGREAVCTCDWAGEVTEVKALLETGELILRGGIRKRVPFNEISRVRVMGDCLCFEVGCETVQLILGSAMAAKWAETFTTPPPSLARKLGIDGKSVVRIIGKIADENLNAAVAEAGRISDKEANLIVACVDTPGSLHAMFKHTNAVLSKGVPIWVVYSKGAGHVLNEDAVRSFLRGHGLMDTKVVSVSRALTALRFKLRESD